jgi:hypothetical protein
MRCRASLEDAVADLGGRPRGKSGDDMDFE